MQTLRIGLLGLAAGAMALAAGVPARAAGFDGTWAVTVNCPRTPKGVLGYTYRFEAQVKGGVLHGQKGKSGEVSSLTIDGKIAADGAAGFKANGVTNNPDYVLKHRPTGSPYHYTAVGKFEVTHGAAHRTSGRKCDYSFVKK
jgi:hypothetical protein